MEKIEKKKSSTQKQVIEMHQHSQEMREMRESTEYSSEVLEWQKMAKKEKVISPATPKEQRIISVRRYNFNCMFFYVH